ncbi:MAG: alkaline phosphatase family protein [Pseudomonadota bacterium]
MSEKMVIFGLDAADKDLMQQWVSEGYLPNFKALMDRAAWGEIENPRSMEAGSAWPCFYYGSQPAAHGQYDGHRRFNPGNYAFEAYAEDDLPRDPIWTILAKAGKRSFLIDVPYIRVPDHPNCQAVMGWGTHTPIPDAGRIELEASSPELYDEIHERFGEDPLGGFMCDHYRPRSETDLTWFRDALIKRIRTRTEMTKHCMETKPWDLFLSVFCECHCMGHHAWHLHDPTHLDHDPELVAKLGDPIRDIYVAIDEALGAIAAQCDDDTNLMVYMSHGMGKGYSGTRLLDRILTRLESGGKDSGGYNTRKVLRSAWKTVWQKSPRPVKTLLNPIRSRARKAYYNDGFQPNREQRRCFEVYNNDRSAGLRINLAGRERDGIVQPGAEYDQLCNQLIEDLKQVINDETGEPLVAEVTRIHKEFNGPALDNLPDLTVTWNRLKPIRKVSSDKVGQVEHDHGNIRSGDHLPYGMFLCAGPQVRQGRLNDRVKVADISTTVAATMEVSNDQLEGEVIKAIA